jgi:ribose 5-phosphate isomerase B
MKIAVAFDHRGVRLREAVLELLRGEGHEVVDLGTDTDAVRIDYPDKAREIGDVLEQGDADSSSAAPASAPRSPPRRSAASEPRSATTRTRPTRASSTTT